MKLAALLVLIANLAVAYGIRKLVPNGVSDSLAETTVSISHAGEAESLPGWIGDVYRPGGSHHGNKKKERRSWIQQVSTEPRAYVWHAMLSESEANHIIRRAAPSLRRSTVVGKDNGGVVDQIRTSYGMFIRRMSDPIIEGIEKRIATWTNTSLIQQEDIQVLRYVDGQKYEAHHDGLGRLATVVMFLNEAEAGGETIFPNGEWLDPEMAKSFTNVSECAQDQLGIKPKKGDAILFYDKNPDGTDDLTSTHKACPVLRGVKWSAPVWIHVEPFRPEILEMEQNGQVREEVRDPGLCMDYDQRCTQWAEAGECKNNPSFMIGQNTGEQLGTCRHACGLCTPCPSGDRHCYHQNRERAGFLNLEEEVARLTMPVVDVLDAHDEV